MFLKRYGLILACAIIFLTSCIKTKSAVSADEADTRNLYAALDKSLEVNAGTMAIAGKQRQTDGRETVWIEFVTYQAKDGWVSFETDKNSLDIQGEIRQEKTINSEQDFKSFLYDNGNGSYELEYEAARADGDLKKFLGLYGGILLKDAAEQVLNTGNASLEVKNHDSSTVYEIRYIKDQIFENPLLESDQSWEVQKVTVKNYCLKYQVSQESGHVEWAELSYEQEMEARGEIQKSSYSCYTAFTPQKEGDL